MGFQGVTRDLGKHSQGIHTWANVTLMTHMMHSQRIAPKLDAFIQVLILGDCLHPLWVKYLGFLR